MLAISMAAFTFTSCEDVPEPYGIPGAEVGGDDTNITEEPVGDGTLTNPFNALAITNLVSAMPAGVESTEDYYIKGVVVSIKENFTTQFGNAAFHIADSETGTTKFYVFRTLYLGNKKYTSGDVLNVGDEVVVCGKVVNYMGNTPETVQNQSYLVSINGKTSSEGGSDQPSAGEAKGDGTVDNPFNSIAANQFASSLAAGETSDVVYVKGKVASIKENYTTQYGNAAFYISDDGTATDQFYVFRALYLNNEKYTSGDLLSVGDDVVICGKLTNYMGNTPETVQGEAYLYSWTQNGGSTGGDNPGGEVTENSITVTASSFGLANSTEMGTQTLSDGTVLAFDGGGNTNVPKYYNSGKNIRMYPKNNVKITSTKKIASVILNCDQLSDGTIYNASGDVSAAPGSVNTNNTVITVSNINANETLITNVSSTTGAPSQIRVVSLTINYVE